MSEAIAGRAMRIDDPCFEGEAVRRVFAALNADGGEARIVGGAIRNALLMRPIVDIDFATTTTPDETRRRAEAAGFQTVPTGIEHGTVLLVAQGRDGAGSQTFEVTTLREDVETDGRRAVVRFGTDWVADASRRDFTMNALYRDVGGMLLDPLGGLGDAMAGRVRFIGDAARRIREDALRILRFFRFYAEYGTEPLDEAGLSACSAQAERIAGLSGERVRAELLKTLVAPGAREALAAMADHGILQAVLGATAPLGGFARLTRLATVDDQASDPALRLASLAPDAAAGRLWTRRLRLSRREADRLNGAIGAGLNLGGPGAGGKSAGWTDHDLRTALYRHGRERTLDGLLIAAVRASDPQVLIDAHARAARMETPVFPLSGRDVVVAGAQPGPRVGVVLNGLEGRWIAEGFPDEARVRQLLADALAAP